MRRAKHNKTTKLKVERSRRIVRLCMRLARKKLKPHFVDLIADHIVAKLPAPLMRRLIKGDHGKPMFEAMKLTAPYFA